MNEKQTARVMARMEKQANAPRVTAVPPTLIYGFVSDLREPTVGFKTTLFKGKILRCCFIAEEFPDKAVLKGTVLIGTNKMTIQRDFEIKKSYGVIDLNLGCLDGTIIEVRFDPNESVRNVGCSCLVQFDLKGIEINQQLSEA